MRALRPRRVVSAQSWPVPDLKQQEQMGLRNYRETQEYPPQPQNMVTHSRMVKYTKCYGRPLLELVAILSKILFRQTLSLIETHEIRKYGKSPKREEIISMEYIPSTRQEFLPS